MEPYPAESHPIRGLRVKDHHDDAVTVVMAHIAMMMTSNVVNVADVAVGKTVMGDEDEIRKARRFSATRRWTCPIASTETAKSSSEERVETHCGSMRTRQSMHSCREVRRALPVG